MKVPLISDCADRAVSEPCDGAWLAASDATPDTVSCSLNEARASVNVRSGVLPAPTCTPVRRIVAKLGADTSMAYSPNGKSSTAKRPFASVLSVRATCSASPRTITGAFATGLASGANTIPAIAPVSADCACRPTEPATNTTHTAAISRPPRRHHSHIFCSSHARQYVERERYKRVLDGG
jgi:hypothetical protein